MSMLRLMGSIIPDKVVNIILLHSEEIFDAHFVGNNQDSAGYYLNEE